MLFARNWESGKWVFQHFRATSFCLKQNGFQFSQRQTIHCKLKFLFTYFTLPPAEELTKLLNFWSNMEFWQCFWQPIPWGYFFGIYICIWNIYLEYISAWWKIAKQVKIYDGKKYEKETHKKWWEKFWNLQNWCKWVKLLITSFQFLWAMSSNLYFKSRIFLNLPRIDELALNEILFGNIKDTTD